MATTKLNPLVAGLLAVSVLTISASGPALARRDGPAHGTGHGASHGPGHSPHVGRSHHYGGDFNPLERLERRLGELDLGAATRTEIEVLLNDARAEAREIRGRLEKSQGELLALLEQHMPDEQAVLARADEVGTLATALRKSQLSALLQVRAKLTPEQRSELKPDKRGRGRACDQRS